MGGKRLRCGLRLSFIEKSRKYTLSQGRNEYKYRGQVSNIHLRSSHVQLKDPITLVHFAFGLQSFALLVHSLKSQVTPAEKINYNI